MDMSYNVVEIDRAHRNDIEREIQRENLATLARTGRAKPSRIVIARIVNAIQRAIQHSPAAEQGASPVGEVVRATANN